MLTSNKVLTTLSFLAIAAANPISRATSCASDYTGLVTLFVKPPITDIGVYEWRPVNEVGGHISLVQTPTNDALRWGEFSIEFAGQSGDMYHIKPVVAYESKFALSGTAEGDLSFAIPNSDGSQDFTISCADCSFVGTFLEGASKCVITHHATGKCVSGGDPGATLTLEACNGGNEQLYSFQAQIVR